MYLTAQRVLSTTGQCGVNVFLYSHGHFVWAGAPAFDVATNPGELVDSIVEVPPRMNRVRSYLDIAAPDEARWPEIVAAFDALRAAPAARLPHTVVIGRVQATVNMERALAPAYRFELPALFAHAQLFQHLVPVHL